MYKACIFDLDGTLTNTLDSLTYSTNKTLEEMGLKTITKDQCRSFVGDGARCLMGRALRASGDSLRGLKKVWKCTAESLEKIVCTMYVLMMALFRC